MTYVLGEEYDDDSTTDTTRFKVRVNGQFMPKRTNIGFPDDMESFRKTTLAQVDEVSQWEFVEDRVPGQRDQAKHATPSHTHDA